MRGMPEQGRVVLSFGRFALVPGERLLTEEGAPVELGARTLDTLSPWHPAPTRWWASAR